jgi:hypothetical protein
MDTEEFDPLKAGEDQIIKLEANRQLTEEVHRLQARQEAFRDLADRFYMLWWNLPGATLRQVDEHVVDMFRMFMDLAPFMGVSRNGIPELRECCGRKRVWKDDALTGDSSQTLVMAAVSDPVEVLGWCPGDIIRRITRFFGVKYCEKCDRRRRAINAFFGCGGP